MENDKRVETRVIGHREPRYQGEPKNKREIRKLVNFPTLRDL